MAEAIELPVPADERRGDRAREGGHVRPQADQAPRFEGLALALRRDGSRRLHEDRVSDEVVGRMPDQHLVRPGRLLESRRDVDGVTGRELLVGGRLPDDHLARVDAGARRDPDPVLAGELSVDTLESVAHRRRRTHRAEGVVLVDGRHSEHCDDRVADELLDRAAVPLESRLHGVEVAPHHATQRLGVEPLAQRRRADDVGEHHGDDLPGLGDGRPVGEARAALVAEAGVRVVLAPTRAAGHGRTLCPGRGTVCDARRTATCLRRQSAPRAERGCLRLAWEGGWLPPSHGRRDARRAVSGSTSTALVSPEALRTDSSPGRARPVA